MAIFTRDRDMIVSSFVSVFSEKKYRLEAPVPFTLQGASSYGISWFRFHFVMEVKELLVSRDLQVIPKVL
jgi:hypothetical protein